jgi:hypothetical protein
VSGGELTALIVRTRGRLYEVLPGADVRVSGGVLVEGEAADDLDLVVLVEDVGATASSLAAAGFPSLYEEEWRDDWAAFRDPGPPQIDVVVTGVETKGGDHHRRAWELLMRDRVLLAEYRALKARGDDYEARKAAFFERVVAQLPRA